MALGSQALGCGHASGLYSECKEDPLEGDGCPLVFRSELVLFGI